MKNLDIFSQKINEYAQAIVAGLKEGNEEAVQEAFKNMLTSVSDGVKADYEAVQNSTDKSILAKRGIRQLTSNEQKYFEEFISANKSKDYKQAISNISVAFPETEIDDIYREMADEHELLSVINFQNVKTVTKWIMDDTSVDKAVWGELSAEISKEISGAVKLVEMTQCKLSAYAIVPLDVLDLGPAFVEAFIRRLLSNALYSGLEYGILKGKGVSGEPIGLNRDIHNGVSVNSTTGYPAKSATVVTDFKPATYGNLLSTLCKTEKGNYRAFNEACLVVNPVDFYKKIMPASTVLMADGTYKTNVFPYPTKVVKSTQLSENEAILFIPNEYFFGIGTSKDGTIEYSDEFKFLEDKRAFKIKTHANGRAYDNTVAIVLDITNVDPYYMDVEVKNTVNTTVTGTVATDEVADEEVADETAEG